VDGLNRPGLDELMQRGFRDTNVSADSGEPNTPFRDETPREPGRGIQYLCCLLKGEQPITNQIHVHIASPSAGWLVQAAQAAGS
jgi:hypothetical protein